MIFTYTLEDEWKDHSSKAIMEGLLSFNASYMERRQEKTTSKRTSARCCGIAKHIPLLKEEGWLRIKRMLRSLL